MHCQIRIKPVFLIALAVGRINVVSRLNKEKKQRHNPLGSWRCADYRDILVKPNSKLLGCFCLLLFRSRFIIFVENQTYTTIFGEEFDRPVDKGDQFISESINGH